MQGYTALRRLLGLTYVLETRAPTTLKIVRPFFLRMDAMTSTRCDICGNHGRLMTDWLRTWFDCPNCGIHDVDDDDIPDDTFLIFDLEGDYGEEHTE
jgi:hypothetical protein